MEDIADDNRRAEQKRLTMLKKWHKKFAHKATYLVLVQALANSGRNSQAADVCKIDKSCEVVVIKNPCITYCMHLYSVRHCMLFM